MKRFTITLVSLLALSVCASGVNAQGLPEMPQSAQIEKTDEQKHNERIAVLLGRRESGPKPERRIVKEGLLAPSLQDVSDNERFLEQPNSGLIRLLPRESYDPDAYDKPKKINLRGGGAYYSFFYVAHEYGYGSDIELDHDKLSAGFAGADFGMLADLGAVPLTEITLDDSRVAYLAGYRPPTNEPGARVEQHRISNGFLLSGIEYRRTLPLKVGSTYLVRSIVYRSSDVLVAFTVTRKDDDGSAIIVWKRLKLYQTPELN